MASLKEKIKEDLSQALKGRDEVASSVLRMISAAVLNKEKEKRYKIGKNAPSSKDEELAEKSQLTEEEMGEVIFSEAKKRKESILEFERGKRMDLVEKETKELEVLKKYLPEQLGEEEIRKLVKETIEKTGAKDIKDMGKVMGDLAMKVKGKADGGTVSRVVREMLIPQK